MFTQQKEKDRARFLRDKLQKIARIPSHRSDRVRHNKFIVVNYDNFVRDFLLYSLVFIVLNLQKIE
jgi:hypothetical protein